MKAITICQPYAHLIAIGEKRVENRTWETKYRGELLIHAGKSRSWLSTYPGCNPSNLVFGAIIASATLVDCVHLADILTGRYDREFPWLKQHKHTEGPWCWILQDVVLLPGPIPVSGYQGLWNYMGSLAAPDQPQCLTLFPEV